MIYTKKQRRKIYEQILWTIGDDNRDGVCIILYKYFKPKKAIARMSIDDVGKYFPEFWQIKTEMLGPNLYVCFEDTPIGNAQRRLALEKSIQLTYE